jgi:hypothetical protein
MNDLIRALARQAGLTRMKSNRYASISDTELSQLVELVVDQCAESAGSVEECRRYRDLIRQQLNRHFGLDLKC